MDAPPRRVSVVGSTGTGKTTFARRLAEILDVQHTELDALAWEPNWRLVDAETLQARVRDAIAGDAWVVDGNYGGRGARQLIWAKADTIVWLDFSLAVIYWRLLRRTIARVRSGREYWPGTGNRETIGKAFFSRESLFVWALRTYWRRKRNYGTLFASPDCAHLRKLRFRRPSEAEAFLEVERAAAARRI